MNTLQTWTRLPSCWIETGGLKDFRWGNNEGANNLAALMLLTVICHHADQSTGIAKLTYTQLSDQANLSRAKVSAGLTVLEQRQIILREHGGQSSYGLNYFQETPWAQFPAKGLYTNGTVEAFSEFKLRLPVELHAMKLYFLFASRRDSKTNLAHLSYDKIEDYSGVGKNQIRSAISVLAANHLVHAERLPSNASEYGTSSAYRLAHLNTRQHMGTFGRSLIS